MTKRTKKVGGVYPQFQQERVEIREGGEVWRNGEDVFAAAAGSEVWEYGREHELMVVNSDR